MGGSEGNVGMAATTIADALWDARDVAAYLKVSRSWVYHQAEAGQLPCLRIGGLLRFNPAAVRAFTLGEGTATGKILNMPLRGKL